MTDPDEATVKKVGNTAESCGKVATRWLWVSAAMVILVVVYGIWAFGHVDDVVWSETVVAGKKVREIREVIPWAFLAPVVLGATALLTLPVWTMQLYGTAKHNQTVNQQKADALATALVLLDAVGEQSEDRSVVLSQAMQSAFSPVDSGYTKGGGGGPLQVQLTELLKAK